MYYLELLRASEGTLSRWSRLYLQSLVTNPHWARAVGYGPFSLCVIHKVALAVRTLIADDDDELRKALGDHVRSAPMR
jgi:hypothetical protein